MKLTARDSDAFLKAPDKKSLAVLLYGPDGGLVRERSRQIASIILGPKPDPLNKIELTAEQLKTDTALLHDELCALSLMGGQRLVIVQGATDKLTSAINDALSGVPPTAYLIAEAEELSASSSLRGLFERHEKLASLPCYRDEGRALDDVIRSSLQGYGLTITPDALRYLVANLGNDRGVTLSELQKISIYMGTEKEVTLPVVLALTDYNASETTEDICHLTACGELAPAQILLARMLGEGVQPVAIVRALLRHFQRLDITRAHVDNGMPADQAVASLRPAVFFKYVPKMKRALILWRSRTLKTVLNLLLRTEKELKSSAAPAPLIIAHAISHAARLANAAH